MAQPNIIHLANGQMKGDTEIVQAQPGRFSLGGTKIFSLLLFYVLLIGCRVQLVAPYDLALLQRTEEVSRQVDKFHLIMAAADGEESAHKDHKLEYIDIEVQLRSILDQNRVRPKNEETTRIAQLCLDQWRAYAKRHADAKSLSQQDAELNRMAMLDMLHSLYVAEKAKSRIKDH